jgi:hypothetical protein
MLPPYKWPVCPGCALQDKRSNGFATSPASGIGYVVFMVVREASPPVSGAQYDRRIFEGRKEGNSQQSTGHAPQVRPNKKRQQDGDRV